jgi:hypothetical protein
MVIADGVAKLRCCWFVAADMVHRFVALTSRDTQTRMAPAGCRGRAPDLLSGRTQRNQCQCLVGTVTST